MKKKLNPKRSLVVALVVLLLAVSALIGTTFAYFSESINSDLNKIISGRLDVGFNYWDATSGEYKDATNNPCLTPRHCGSRGISRSRILR